MIIVLGMSSAQLLWLASAPFVVCLLFLLCRRPITTEGPQPINRSVDEKQSKWDYLCCFEPPQPSTSELEQKARDRKLYHQLQNLEDYPDAVHAARQRLSDLFDETLKTARMDPSSILQYSTYDKRAIKQYSATVHASAGERYRAYMVRRKSGGPRELYPTKEHAIQWLRLAAVVKYVDGGWLSNVVNFETGEGGRTERSAARVAWQIMTEEFGDGDLSKNHVSIYHELLKTLGKTRSGDDSELDDGAPRCWKAAVAQQSIGLMAGEYLPEALGFNLAYETLPYHLLVTAYELRELKIDPYYFHLHVAIDNPDCGHAALGLEAVDHYMEGVRKARGDKAAQAAWRRVQAGMALADGIPTTPWSPVDFVFDPNAKMWRPAPAPVRASSIETEVVDLFQRKSSAACGLHCASRSKIKGRTIEEWLDPREISRAKIRQFVQGLGTSKPWITPGDPSSSRLVREMLWGGRMFGAFSGSEIFLLDRWIASLGPTQHVKAWQRVDHLHQPRQGLGPRQLAIATDERTREAIARLPGTALSAPIQTFHLDGSPRSAALWFTHLALLEHFALSPAKLATPLGMTVIRILRAQHGFTALSGKDAICGGIESDATDQIGLWDIGQTAFQHLSKIANPVTLSILWSRLTPNEVHLFEDMLALRTRPYANHPVLLGMTYACTGLDWERLEARCQGILHRIRKEIRIATGEYLLELKEGETDSFRRGARCIVDFCSESRR